MSLGFTTSESGYLPIFSFLAAVLISSYVKGCFISLDSQVIKLLMFFSGLSIFWKYFDTILICWSSLTIILLSLFLIHKFTLGFLLLNSSLVTKYFVESFSTRSVSCNFDQIPYVWFFVWPELLLISFLWIFAFSFPNFDIFVFWCRRSLKIASLCFCSCFFVAKIFLVASFVISHVCQIEVHSSVA